MSLANLLDAYAGSIGMGPLSRAADGAFMLVFDGRYKLRFREEGARQAVVEAKVGTLPDDEAVRPEALDRLLSTALGRMRAGAETLSLDDDGRTVRLHRRFGVDLAPAAFPPLLTDFVNAAAFWTRIASGTAARTAAAPPPFQMMFR